MWLPSIAVVAFMLVWVVSSRRALAMQSGWLQTVTQVIPWVGRLLQVGRLATFTDLMAMLVEHRVPLQESLPLAASVSGDRAMRIECDQLAADVVAGRSSTHDAVMSNVGDKVAVPNLIRWQLTSGMNDEELARSLRASSRVYRHQADQLADRCSIRLPVYFTLCIGGTATLVYALAVLTPWYSLLQQLSL